MVELKFRNFVTLLVMAGLVGGAGIAIMYDSLGNQVILTEVTDPDGTFTRTYADNSLDNSQTFGIWLGAILGFAGAIVAVLYKAKTGSGEDP